LKAALYKGPNKIVIGEIPVPEPKENEIQIKVASVGICGTDIHLYKGFKGGSFTIENDVVFGHEFGGIITKLGSRVPSFFKVGQRIVVEPNIGCGLCKTCISGNYVHCESGQRVIGIHRNGGFAEFTTAPHEKVFAIPDNFSLKAASVFEPFAICVYGIKRAPILPGDTVAILGPGVAGLHFTMLAKACGAAKVILSGTNPSRLALGEKLGADIIINVKEKNLQDEIMKETNGRGAEYIFESAGVQDTVSQVINIAAPKGKICIYGVPIRPIDNVDFAEFLMRDLTMVAAAGAQNTFSQAIKIVSSGILDIEKVITHTFPLEEIEHAFEVTDKRLDGVAKSIIVVNPDLV
jgi:L-iditol 2-dehydrogenase